LKTGDYFRRTSNPEQLYLPQILKDGHLSARGQFLIAHLLADYLREQSLLPAKNFVRQKD
jgi:hypothetical protein